MCELLALSSSRPAHLTFSLQTLAARGGAGGSTHDAALALGDHHPVGQTDSEHAFCALLA
ncbi:MAG: class II glutamine amidotransferase, partial [Burkholderiaceae bacterium]